MKTLIMMSLTLTVSFTTFAASSQNRITEANEKLAITGFQILEDTDSLLKLKFRDEEKSIGLSKQKFSAEKDAKAFCEKNSMSLDKEGLATALLLAMSGASEADERINAAIAFSFTAQGETVGGIWAWTGNNQETVEVIQNGKGLSNDTTPIAEMAQAAKALGIPEMALVPAICK